MHPLDMMRDRRVVSSPRAESNFQLRVRKRGGMTPIGAESNFQLRVRKAFLDRIRDRPQVRSAAEDNFQLRVCRSTARSAAKPEARQLTHCSLSVVSGSTGPVDRRGEELPVARAQARRKLRQHPGVS